jgi:DnaK suppressor protein
MATTKKSATKKKAVAKKAPAKKATAPKSVTKKAPSTKAASKKAAPAKQAAVKKPVAKKAKPVPAAASKAAAKQAAKPAVKAVATPKKPVTAAPTARKAAKVKSTAGTVVESIEPYREKPGEDYMNDTQQEHFRNILLAWKRELMEEVDRTVHHMQDEAANFPDPNDRATQESEFSMELRARDRERKLIKKIEETLGKLDHDEYGYCDSCGVEIGIRRLEARPTAALCIDCKTLDEIREKQMGS